MTKRVFVSYSRRNQYIADRLIVDLGRAGYVTWFDQHDIPINDVWQESIEKAILDNDYFLYLWSPEAQESPYVQKEYELAQKHVQSSNIGIARVAGNSTDMPADLRKLQHLDLGDNYWNGLRQLLEWLGFEKIELTSSHDLLANGTDVRSAVVELKNKERRSWSVHPSEQGSLPRKFFCVPIEPNGYAMSWLVAEETEKLRLQNEIHVVLKFSGPNTRATVQEVLDFLVANGSQPQIIYIEGPQNTRDNCYEIPNDKPRIWKDCVDLAISVMSRYCNSRTVHFFLDSPQSIVFPIAARLREMFPYHIYNLNGNSNAGQPGERYKCVYSGRR